VAALQVNFLRNALAHAGKGQRQMVLAAINTVFAQDSFDSGSHNGVWLPINYARSSRNSPS
jgi:hypothetical protein